MWLQVHCRKGTQALSRQLRKALGSRNQGRISIRFHLVLEGALRNRDVRSDWFSFEWLPSSCWIKFRFYLLGEPALFQGSPTFAFIAPHRVLCRVHFVTFFLLIPPPFAIGLLDRPRLDGKIWEYFVPFGAPLTLEGEPFYYASKAHWPFVLVSGSALLSPRSFPQTHVQVIHAFIHWFIDYFFLICLPTNCAGMSFNCLSPVTVTNTE